MKIKIETLKNFIDSVYLGGTNNKAIFNFTSDGLRIDVRNEANVVGVRALLEKEKIEDYQEISEVAFVNLGKLSKIIGDFFQDNVELTFVKDDKEKNYVSMTISDKNKYTHTLALIDSLEKFDLSKVGDIPFEDEITIPESVLSEALSAVGTLEAEKITLNVSEKRFVCLVESPDGNLQLEVPTELKNKVKGTYSIMLGKYFFEIIKVLKGDVKVRLHSDDSVPMVLFNKNDDGDFTYAIAKRSVD